MSLWKKLIKLYQHSPENRRQIHLLLGFIVIPIIGMSALYLYARLYLIH